MRWMNKRRFDDWYRLDARKPRIRNLIYAVAPQNARTAIVFVILIVNGYDHTFGVVIMIIFYIFIKQVSGRDRCSNRQNVLRTRGSTDTETLIKIHTIVSCSL
jgi:hypothetical protein